MKKLILIFLAACATNAPTPTDKPLACDPAAGSTCEAVYDLARAQCERAERCSGVEYDTCIDDAVREGCTRFDCTATYSNWDELFACIERVDATACATIGQPPVCNF